MISKSYKFAFITLSFIFYSFCSAQVIINEYSASNLSTVTDNYSSYDDWIELYNTDVSAVNLGGYFLSDNPNDSTK
ncbi:MAG: lamin tail domain-containing protein, partial [Bacteroidales bacterium]|nr:lamin tail domain-containing protein [Bacteroidales bacterium]